MNNSAFMSFHILFLVENTLPTIFHNLVSYIEKKTANWRYFPQMTKAQNYVTFNCALPEGLALGKDGEMNILR